VSHRIVWSRWSFWLMIQNDQARLETNASGARPGDDVNASCFVLAVAPASWSSPTVDH